jgi:hypothetical protein
MRYTVMEKQHVLHFNPEVAGATLQYRSSRRYTVMQKQQALHGYAEVTGAIL